MRTFAPTLLIIVLLTIGSAPNRSLGQAPPSPPNSSPPQSPRTTSTKEPGKQNEEQTPKQPTPITDNNLAKLQSQFWQLPSEIGPITHHRVIQRGQVVLVRQGEIYVDLGRGTGIRDGDLIRIKRTYRFIHPVTRNGMVEWLPIGIAKVTGVDQAMSKAALDSDWLIDKVLVGDNVECVVVSAPPEPSPASLKDSLSDASAKAWLAAWRASVGKTLKAHIGIWEEYLQSQPQSPYAAMTGMYLQGLRAMDARLASPGVSPIQHHIAGLEHSAPRSNSPRQPIDLVFYIANPNSLAGAWLHYRRGGTRTYRKAPLQREGELYLRGQIPADVVEGQAVHYFVEIATHDGKIGAAVGTADKPVAVAIESSPISQVFTTPRNRSRVSMSASYLDFGDLPADGSSDSFTLFEADFFYRLRGALYGIRTGFGALSGRQGRNDVGLHYGYTEIELRTSTNVSWSGRLIVGVGSEIGLGGEGRLRLGSEQSTNLSVGYSRIAKIGFVTDMRMQWNAMPRAPLGLSVAVTDQPNQGKLGVRLTTDLGYQIRPWFQPTVRLSYQARSVNQNGIGAGLGLVLNW